MYEAILSCADQAVHYSRPASRACMLDIIRPPQRRKCDPVRRGLDHACSITLHELAVSLTHSAFYPLAWTGCPARNGSSMSSDKAPRLGSPLKILIILSPIRRKNSSSLFDKLPASRFWMAAMSV